MTLPSPTNSAENEPKVSLRFAVMADGHGSDGGINQKAVAKTMEGI
jgi:hypothetical protein